MHSHSVDGVQTEMCLKPLELDVWDASGAAGVVLNVQGCQMMASFRDSAVTMISNNDVCQ